LLNSLAAQRGSDGAVSLIVVDNDAAGSARPVVEAARSAVPWPIAYAVEPVRNIALARNRAVALALAGGAELVAFIDDDDLAPPHWLHELRRVQRETGADVVTGPVVPLLHRGAPGWATPGLFTHSRSRSTGTVVATAVTSNSLVSAGILAALDGPFDPEFGLAGGSDSHLFLRATQRGARIVWANDAFVNETIDAARTNLRWVLQRAYREGNCGAHVERRVLRRWRTRRLAKAVARLVLGVAAAAGALVGGRQALVSALRQIVMACGAIAGTAGHRYFEYRRPRGE